MSQMKLIIQLSQKQQSNPCSERCYQSNNLDVSELLTLFKYELLRPENCGCIQLDKRKKEKVRSVIT